MPQVDLFHQIRTKFERSPPSPVAKRHEKVLARNQASFVTELPDKWRVDYERRNGHRHTGFFAYSHVPYRSFGNLKYTDGHDLLADHLRVTITRHHKAYNLSHFRIHEDEWTDTGSTSIPQHTIKVVRSNSQRRPLPHSRNAGLSALRLALGASVRSMREMSTMSCLTDTLRREEERATFLQEIRVPKLTKTFGPENAPLQLHNPSIYLSPMVHTASSKACLTLTDTFHKKPPTRVKPKGTPAAASQDAEDESRKDNETEATSTDGDKSIAAAAGKSRTAGPNLYVALAAAQFKLHTRDQELRSQISDSDTRRQQKRQCLGRLKCVHSILCCLHNIKMRDLRGREPLSAATIRAIAQRPLHSLTRDHLHHDTHHHHHHHHHHHVSHITHTPTHHHHHPHTRHVKTHQKEQQVESWEDLLALEEPHPLPLHSSTTMHHYHHHHGNHRPHRTVPPWQRQVVYVKDEDKNVKQLHDCIEAFQHAKNSMAQELRVKLAKRKQHMLKQLVVKLQGLPLGPNVEDCLEVMRESAYQASLEERAKEENKPAWFAQLEKEASAVFDMRDKEVQEALEKLKQFLTVDNDAIPHVTEKLCLLVMSLPANQLCNQPVIGAIQFVLQHILKAPPNLCSQWLAIRQLPQVTTELTSPAYVFGLPI